MIRRSSQISWRARPVIGDELRDSRALMKRPLQVPLDPFGNNKRRRSQLLHFVVYSSTPVVLRVLFCCVFCSLAHSQLPLSGRGTASDSRQTPPPKAAAKHCPRLTNENTLSADWRYSHGVTKAPRVQLGTFGGSFSTHRTTAPGSLRTLSKTAGTDIGGITLKSCSTFSTWTVRTLLSMTLARARSGYCLGKTQMTCLC